MSVKLLTEHHLEFQRLKGDCTGSSESVHVKMPHCWKSHVAAQIKNTILSKEINRLIRSQVSRLSVYGDNVAGVCVEMMGLVSFFKLTFLIRCQVVGTYVYPSSVCT